MRGKDCPKCGSDNVSGITPAYAGKSQNLVQIALKQKDHPRLCGEKPDTVPDVHSGEGSPPPMRGKVSSAPELLENLRITPAYAGKRPTTA